MDAPQTERPCSDGTSPAVMSGLLGGAAAVAVDIGIAHELPLPIAATLAAGAGGLVAYLFEHDGLWDRFDTSFHDCVGAVESAMGLSATNTTETSTANGSNMTSNSSTLDTPSIAARSQFNTRAIMPDLPSDIPWPFSEMWHQPLCNGIVAPQVQAEYVEGPPNIVDCGTGLDTPSPIYDAISHGGIDLIPGGEDGIFTGTIADHAALPDLTPHITDNAHWDGSGGT